MPPWYGRKSLLKWTLRRPLRQNVQTKPTLNPMNPITVLLAEDHTIVREGLLVLLKLESDIQVIGQAENGRQAVELAAKLSPDVVVMDIAMPCSTGWKPPARFFTPRPKPRCWSSPRTVTTPTWEQVMALGAAGYLIKQTASHMLAVAIRDVCSGKPFFSPSIAKRLYHHNAKPSHGRTAEERGSPSDIPRDGSAPAHCRGEGQQGNRRRTPHSASKTVEKHRQKVMEKLNIHDTASLTRYAISAGIIESSVQVTIL